MNKKGSLGIAIITSIFIFICFIGVVNLIMPEVTNFRIAMDCANPSGISDGTKLSCLVSDTVVVYLIFLIFSIVIGGLLEKFVF